MSGGSPRNYGPQGSGGMDLRTPLAIFLCLLLYYVYLGFFAPPPAPVEEAPADTPVAVVPDAPLTPTPTHPAAPAQTTQGELCRVSFELTTSPSSLRSMVLLDHKAPYDITPVWRWALDGFSGTPGYGEDPGPRVMLTEDALGMVVGAGSADVGSAAELVTSGPSAWVTRSVSEGAPDIEVVRTLRRASSDPCHLELEVSWRNTGASDFDGDLWLGIFDRMPSEADRYNQPVRPVADVGGEYYTAEDLTELEGSAFVPVGVSGGWFGSDEPAVGRVGWFGVADAYFAALLLPEAASDDAHAFFGRQQRVASSAGGDPAFDHGVHYVATTGLAAGQTHTASFKVYAGRKLTNEMEAFDPVLVDAVDFGFFAALSWPLLWLLRVIYSVVGSWGLAIITLTFFVKALFFPLTQSAFKSSQAMQALQPKLAELREKYQESDPQRMNTETMKLFQENGVNPLGGCLPMLVQMPVWFALYSTLLGAVELYQTSFLYLFDLSRPDPYLVAPAVVVGLMMVQQQFVPTGNMDPAQAKIMKFMPLMFGIFFFSFPGGLVVYIFVNMVLSILQQWYIRRTFQPST